VRAADDMRKALSELKAMGDDPNATDQDILAASLRLNVARNTLGQTLNPTPGTPDPLVVGINTFVEEFGGKALQERITAGTPSGTTPGTPAPERSVWSEPALKRGWNHSRSGSRRVRRGVGCKRGHHGNPMRHLSLEALLELRRIPALAAWDRLYSSHRRYLDAAGEVEFDGSTCLARDLANRIERSGRPPFGVAWRLQPGVRSHSQQ
jgi:hypothetical protein